MKAIVTVVCLLIALASAASAATYVVRPDGTGDYPTIQAAIDACVGGDIVELTDGTFKGDGNRDIDYLGKAITVRSASGNAEACTIDCQGSPLEPHRGFVFDQGEGPWAVLRSVRITGGWAQYGGGCQIMASSPILEFCIFEANVAQSSGGGALIWMGSHPILTACTFRANRATDPQGGSGGAGIGDESSPSFVDCVFENNEAQGNAGGAGIGPVYPDPSSVSFEGCVFTGNSAQLGSGGIGVGAGGAEAIVNDCIFRGNSALTSSGAIGLIAGTISINGSTFIDNSAPQGAVSRVGWPGEEASAVLSNCTIFGSAGAEGVLYVNSTQALITLEKTVIALSSEGPAAGGGDPSQYTLTCNDIYGNAGGDYVGPIAGMLGNDGNISEDPWFCNPPASRLIGIDPPLPTIVNPPVPR